MLVQLFTFLCLQASLSFRPITNVFHPPANDISMSINKYKRSEKGKDSDRDMIEANKFLEGMQQKKAAKTERKAAVRLAAAESSSKEPVTPRPSNIRPKQSITGQNIITCREFSLDDQKHFEYIGGFKDIQSAPVYGFPEIAFIGRSNVGKSSLLNCLTGLNKNIAVVSATPGRTQLINMFKCADRVGDLAVFVDLPGYGFAKMPKAQQEEVARFLRSYLEERGALRLAVLLLDPRRPAQDLDLGMLQFLQRERLPYIVVATKCDKLGKNELERSLSTLSRDLGLRKELIVPFSSVTGDGRRSLWSKIRDGIIGKLEVEYDEDDDDEEDEGDEDSWVGEEDDSGVDMSLRI